MLKSILLFFISFSAFCFNIVPGSITVSGISSGAHFAAQFHLSHSSKVNGAALIAGGPYYCSYFNITKALYSCMDGYGSVDTDDLVYYTHYLSYLGYIDPYENLKNDKIFVLAGSNDQTVVPEITKQNKDFYLGLGVDETKILLVDQLNAGHTFPTLSYGNDCPEPALSPYMSSCNFDTAGKILNLFYSLTHPRTKTKNSNIFELSQQPYSSYTLLLSNFSLANKAYAYIPENCQENQACKLHIAFHGCEMSHGTIDKQFIENAGYNEWAENNNIIILYPQTIKNNMIGNQHGCWDWWGYTGAGFSTQNGPQIYIVNKLIEKITDPNFKIP